METLKTTMDKNNKSLHNKNDTKIETMFLEFQTHMMKSTNDIVQSLQVNQRTPNNNVARLSQVYNRTTNSVARSNTNEIDSTQENRQPTFPSYTHPYHTVKVKEKKSENLFYPILLNDFLSTK